MASRGVQFVALRRNELRNIFDTGIRVLLPSEPVTPSPLGFTVEYRLLSELRVAHD